MQQTTFFLFFFKARCPEWKTSARANFDFCYSERKNENRASFHEQTMNRFRFLGLSWSLGFLKKGLLTTLAKAVVSVSETEQIKQETRKYPLNIHKTGSISSFSTLRVNQVHVTGR
jgi:hypothetical protein